MSRVVGFVRVFGKVEFDVAYGFYFAIEAACLVCVFREWKVSLFGIMSCEIDCLRFSTYLRCSWLLDSVPLC